MGTIEYITSENFKPKQNLNDLFLNQIDNTAKYQLYYFMAEYIYNQVLSIDSVHIEEKAHLQHQENLKLNANLNIIYNYSIYKEKKVVQALNMIMFSYNKIKEYHMKNI